MDVFEQEEPSPQAAQEEPSSLSVEAAEDEQVLPYKPLPWCTNHCRTHRCQPPYTSLPYNSLPPPIQITAQARVPCKCCTIAAAQTTHCHA